MEQPKEQKNLRELIDFVEQRLGEKARKQTVIKDLNLRGIDSSYARELVEHLQGIHFASRREEGKKSLKIGLITLAIGLVVTLGTLALSEPGGTYWVMTGALVIGAINILRGIYVMTTSTEDIRARPFWIFGPLCLVGVMVGGGFTAVYLKSAPPSDDFVIFGDNSFWEDETQSIFIADGSVTNTHNSWAIKNIFIEIRALDESENVINTYKVQVVPDTLASGELGTYHSRLTLPAARMSVEPYIGWEWVSPP